MYAVTTILIGIEEDRRISFSFFGVCILDSAFDNNSTNCFSCSVKAFGFHEKFFLPTSSSKFGIISFFNLKMHSPFYRITVLLNRDIPFTYRYCFAMIFSKIFHERKLIMPVSVSEVA